MTIEWELEKAKAFEEIEVEKEKFQLARDTEDAKIMLADETFLDEHAKKWLAEKKKEINDRREGATSEQAARRQEEEAAWMQAEMDVRI